MKIRAQIKQGRKLLQTHIINEIQAIEVMVKAGVSGTTLLLNNHKLRDGETVTLNVTTPSGKGRVLLHKMHTPLI